MIEIPIDAGADRPVYLQVADFFRGLIKKGVYKPGDLLPSQSEIREATGLSVVTIQRAIAVLRGEGLVETSPGRGVAVPHPPTVRVMSSERYRQTRKDARRRRGEPVVSAFVRDSGAAPEDESVKPKFRRVKAPREIASIMGLEPGTLVLRRYFERSLRGELREVSTRFYPLDIVGGTAMEDEEQQPWPGGVVAELEALGVTITDIQEDVRFRMPTPEESDLLAVPQGVGLAEVTRVGWSKGTVVELAFPTLMRADQYIFRYRIKL